MRLPALLAAIIILYAGCACTRGKESGERPSVSVSFEPQKWIVEQIAPGDFNVNVLIPSGSNPETHDPQMETLRQLQKSVAWLHLGTPGFEAATMNSVRENFPDVKILDVSEGVEILSDGHGGAADPHLWSSVRNTRIIAANMLKPLQEAVPGKAATYRDNFLRLDARLRHLDDSLASAFSSGPRHSFMIRHPSLSYFARDYGLTQTAMEIEGKEPTPMQLKQRLEVGMASGATVMFYESEHNPEQSLELARQTGLRPVEISLNTTDWENQILKIAKALGEDSRSTLKKQ